MGGVLTAMGVREGHGDLMDGMRVILNRRVRIVSWPQPTGFLVGVR